MQPVDPTGNGDWALLVLIGLACFIMYSFVFMLLTFRKRFVFVRAKNISLLFAQVTSGSIWLLCGLVSNEHFEGARTVHLRTCVHVGLWGQYGFGLNMWLSILILRLFDAWSVFKQQKLAVQRTRYCVFGCCCMPILVACVVAHVAGLTHADVVMGACVTNVFIKWIVFASLLLNFFVLVYFTVATYAVPPQFNESRSLQLACRLILPPASLSAVLIMSNSWTDATARGIISLCNLMCVVTAFGAVVGPVLVKMCNPEHHEREFQQLTEVYVGPLDTFSEVLLHASTLDHFYTWAHTEAAPVSTAFGQLRPSHLATAHKMLCVQKRILEARPLNAKHATSSMEEFIRLFVGPSATCRIPFTAQDVHSLLRCADVSWADTIAMHERVESLLTEHFGTHFLTSDNVRSYYESVMARDTAIRTLQGRSLLTPA